eukprot:6456972-Amphidinium_carterae.1
MKPSEAESFKPLVLDPLCSPGVDLHDLGAEEFGNIPILGPSVDGHPMRFFDATSRELENSAAIGGMKNPASSIMRAKASHLEL